MTVVQAEHENIGVRLSMRVSHVTMQHLSSLTQCKRGKENRPQEEWKKLTSLCYGWVLFVLLPYDEQHNLLRSPQLGNNTLTFGSLTVPSAVNRNTERTHMSWKWSLGELKWFCFSNRTFLQTCPSMLAAAKTKVNEKISMLSFLCLQKHSPKYHRTRTATHGTEQPENGYLSVAWKSLSSCWL